MSGEYLPRNESPDAHFIAYSGTSLRNYLANASVLEDGSVVYDKRRNTQHAFKETMFLETPTGALEYAASLAFETRDVPVIMEGRIPALYRKTKALPSGVFFPVITLWIPKEEINIVEFIAQALFLGEIGEAFNTMDPVNPAFVLRSRP